MELDVEVICRGSVRLKQEWLVVLIDDEEIIEVVFLFRLSHIIKDKIIYESS